MWREVKILRGGARTLAFGLSSPAAGQIHVQIDGGAAAALKFPATAEGAFAEATLKVELAPGVHAIRLSSPEAAAPVVDYLRID